MAMFTLGCAVGWAVTYLTMKHWDYIVDWWAGCHTPDD